MKYYMSRYYYVILILMASIVQMSCIPNADNDAFQPPIIDPTDIVVDSTQITVDSSFVATMDYILGEWMGQYTGYDIRQGATSAIRRLVFFSPEGFYDSHVQGIVNIEDTISTYKEFEHEHGTYSFDALQQIMRYSIEYDSLLNFMTDKLEYNSGKMRPGIGLVQEYDERIWFSKEKDGKRDWVRTDENLVTAKDNTAVSIVYILKSQQ